MKTMSELGVPVPTSISLMRLSWPKNVIRAWISGSVSPNNPKGLFILSNGYQYYYIVFTVKLSRPATSECVIVEPLRVMVEYRTTPTKLVKQSDRACVMYYMISLCLILFATLTIKPRY